MAMELSDLERSRFRLKTDEGVVERETNGVAETLDVDFSTGMLHVHYVHGEDVVDSRIRMYEADDLERMAVEAGFRDVERYGNFAGGPKRPEDRLVLRRHSMSERGAAVVVDAYSTGARLAPRFAAAGLPVVHVQSSARLPDFYARAFRAGDFVENVVHEGDLEATAARLAAHEPAFVVVGAEPGVPLADALSERLGLPSNGSAQSAARRDKNAMSEALRDAGLRTAEALKTAERERRGRLGSGERRRPCRGQTARQRRHRRGQHLPRRVPRSRQRSRRSWDGPTPCTAPTRSCSSRSCWRGRSSSSTRSAGTASTTSPRSGATTSCAPAPTSSTTTRSCCRERGSSRTRSSPTSNRCSTRSASASAPPTPR